MPAASFRRAAGALAALITLGAAPILTPSHAGAAVADSSVSITDASGDAVRGGTAEPKADIVAASVRNQNDFISLTMKLAKGDDLSGTSENDYVRWALGTHEASSTSPTSRSPARRAPTRRPSRWCRSPSCSNAATVSVAFASGPARPRAPRRRTR